MGRGQNTQSAAAQTAAHPLIARGRRRGQRPATQELPPLTPEQAAEEFAVYQHRMMAGERYHALKDDKMMALARTVVAGIGTRNMPRLDIALRLLHQRDFALSAAQMDEANADRLVGQLCWTSLTEPWDTADVLYRRHNYNDSIVTTELANHLTLTEPALRQLLGDEFDEWMQAIGVENRWTVESMMRETGLYQALAAAAWDASGDETPETSARQTLIAAFEAHIARQSRSADGSDEYEDWDEDWDAEPWS